MGGIVIFYLQLLLQGMTPGKFHNIGLFLQGTRIAWEEGMNNVKERRVEKAVRSHLGSCLFMDI
jgi:hypothetical protein